MSDTTVLDPLGGLRFTNRFTAELPADPQTTAATRQVTGAAFSRVAPTPVSGPRVVAVATEVMDLLDLPHHVALTEAFADVVAGNRLLPGMDPYAACYGGHQFGNWAGQLGDGRAIALGEVVNSRGQHLTLQLKGAGPTPYSRRADGRAVLRSSVREFLCSEAMQHLGVPTTRALSLALTGDAVVRDMFYDGNPAAEPGAVVLRVAPSFVRFGNFQLPASRGDIDLLRALTDHTITADFPELLDGDRPGPDAYAAFFDEVVRRTAELMVQWMRVGFVHGVMNTDNLSILGLTIDYGPYGWLEDFNPGWTPNTTDAGQRRYRYGQQPQVAHWNLVQLANALAPLFPDVAPLQAAIDRYPDLYGAGWQSMMAAKLGLRAFDAAAGDDELVSELHQLLQSAETDMTLFYRGLADVDLHTDDLRTDDLPTDDLRADDQRANVPHSLLDAYYQPAQLTDGYRARLRAWLQRYAARVAADGTAPSARKATMDAVNPKYVLRNYLAQLAIDRSAEGDHAGIAELLQVLRHPYQDQPGMETYAQKRPEWARQRAGCSMLSCSS